ncbi:wax ester/triacylglycerol synthase domain-containing protein, partial [Mycobacterium avium]|uniref:wax ester/triacylglycerol synthase domain-containing protein n=1 Tax=Mycobacterium avium TaxID=1764 RepID=UPI000B0D8DDD
IYDLERNPPPKPPPPLPVPQDLSPNDLMRQGINHLPFAVVGGVVSALSGAVSVAGRAMLEPASTVSGLEHELLEERDHQRVHVLEVGEVVDAVIGRDGLH